jgi:hypothetical protein
MELHERRVAVARRRFPNRRSALDRRIAERREQNAPVEDEWRYSPDPRSSARRLQGDRRSWFERRADSRSVWFPAALPH